VRCRAAARAAELPASFPRDPFDRVIYATAIEYGWRLVSKDERLRAADSEDALIVW
jgi:PIN domain nuclease of toxin-antitoxin system